MTDRDFEIGGRKFKLSKIDAVKQYHIVRRIAPILKDMLPAIQKMNRSGDLKGASEADQFDRIAELVGPIMEGLSKLSDADADRVLFGLLASVEMQQATGNWARVAIDSNLMIQDMDLPVLVQLAGRAFAFNLSGFFAALPRPS